LLLSGFGIHKEHNRSGTHSSRCIKTFRRQVYLVETSRRGGYDAGAKDSMNRFLKPHMEILPPEQQRLWKDYRDIAAMLNAGVSLSKCLAAARAMYGVNFQPSESLKAMVYFEGGDLCTLTQDEKNCIVNAVSKVRNLPRVEILDRRLTIF
jgi:hypothetical protein